MLRQFESEDELRAYVEERIGSAISDADWQAIAPDWSAPFDFADANEILERAAVSGEILADRAEQLERDLARLKAQIPAYDPRSFARAPMSGGMMAIGRLYQQVASSEDIDHLGDPVDLLGLYTLIGRLVHEALAFDFLEEEYRLASGAGMALLMGASTPRDELARPRVHRRRSHLLHVLPVLAKVGPSYSQAFKEGRRQARREAEAAHPLTLTDRIVLAVVESQHSRAMQASWHDCWQRYERYREVLIAEDPGNSPRLRAFSNRHAFRVAARRAQQKKPLTRVNNEVP
ncbi:MAG: hypothetical protein HY873_00280 [Chloroflexi bacterium]|nr:hypothetical protein [Chloroflexota bacterium]